MRLELEEFDFNVQYVQGKTNVGADALSRIQIDSDMTILQLTTKSMTNKNANEQNRQHDTVNPNYNETDHLNVFESLNNNEIYDLPKLYIESSTKNPNTLTYKILNKN